MLDWWKQRGRLPAWVANATCALREDRGRAAHQLAASKARKRSVALQMNRVVPVASASSNSNRPPSLPSSVPPSPLPSLALPHTLSLCFFLSMSLGLWLYASHGQPKVGKDCAQPASRSRQRVVRTDRG